MKLCRKCDEGRLVKRNNMCDACCTKDWRKRNPEKVRAYAGMRYKRDKENILIGLKRWNQKNGYASDKKPKRMKDQLVRAKTRNKYALKGNTCLFCNNPAEHRHHTTKPLEVDKFMFLCKLHHNDIHSKKCVIGEQNE